MSLDRVQKILAQAGIASRRKAEELIREGLVTINGKVAKLGDKASLSSDAIKVEGKLIQKAEQPIYLAFHKPRGVISMMIDSENRPTIASYLTKIKQRIFPVGRLDFNSEGLLLLTNDGAIAEVLQKRDDILRVYHVKVRGAVSAEALARLQRGGRVTEIDPLNPLRKAGKKDTVRPHSVRMAENLQSKSVVEVVIKGSGVADIKALFDKNRLWVEKITRVAIGHLRLHGIAPGTYKMLEKSQVEALIEQPELGQKLIEREAERSKAKVMTAAEIADQLAAEEERNAPVDGSVRIQPKSRDGESAAKPIVLKRRSPVRTGADSGDAPPRRPRAAFGDRKPRAAFGTEAPRSSSRPGFGSRPSASRWGEFDRAANSSSSERRPRTGFADRPSRGASDGARKPGASRGIRPKSRR